MNVGDCRFLPHDWRNRNRLCLEGTCQTATIFMVSVNMKFGCRQGSVIFAISVSMNSACLGNLGCLTMSLLAT